MALWTPLNLSAGKLLFYYDATINSSLTYATSTTISGWADQGPNSINLSQSTTAYFPQVQTGSEINGNQAVLMAASESTGGGQFLEAATSLPAASTVSTLYCGTINSNGTYGRIFSMAPSGGGEDYADGFCVYQEPSAEQVTVAVGGNFGANITISGYGTPFLLRTMIESGSYEQVLNGTSAGVNSITYTPIAANPKIAVGNDASSSTASYAVEALIGTIVGFTGTTTDDNQRLEGWAAWKFGLQTSSGGVLPIGHPYYYAAPTTGSTVSLTACSIASSRGLSSIRGTAAIVTRGGSRGAVIAGPSFPAQLVARESSRAFMRSGLSAYAEITAQQGAHSALSGAPSRSALLLAVKGARATSRATSGGQTALASASGSRAFARGTASFWSQLAARVTASGRGSAQPSGVLTLTATAKASGRGAAQPSGVAALSARAAGTAQGRGTLGAAANLVALSARAAGLGTARATLSLVVALTARARGSAAGAGVISGRLALSATSSARGQGRGTISAVAGLVALVGRSGSAATGRALISAKAALSARSSSASSMPGNMRATALLTARAASTAMLKGSSTLFVFLAARASAATRMAAVMRGSVSLSARSQSRGTGKGTLAGLLPLLALAASSRAIATGRASSLLLSNAIASIRVQLRSSSANVTTSASSIDVDSEGPPQC